MERDFFSNTVFHSDKDGTTDKNSKVQLEFENKGMREKVRTESSTITHNLQLCHFFLCLPYWETAALPSYSLVVLMDSSPQKRQ